MGTQLEYSREQYNGAWDCPQNPAAPQPLAKTIEASLPNKPFHLLADGNDLHVDFPNDDLTAEEISTVDSDVSTHKAYRPA